MSTLAVSAGYSVTLPDGTDTSDPAVRVKVDAMVRRAYAASHGRAFAQRLVLWWPLMTDIADGIAPVIPISDTRPAMSVHSTNQKVAAAALKGIGLQNGLGQLVEVDEVRRTATFAHLDQATIDLRDRIAEAMGKDPLALEIATRRDEAGAIVAVHVLRSTAWIEEPAKRRAAWLTRINEALPSPDERTWRYSDVPGANQIRLDLLNDPLDITIPWTDDPTETIAPSTPWRLGVDENGCWINVNLVKTAMGLISGATRSGKSVCTYGLIAHVMRMGPAARLLVADPNDTTIAPFESKVSWSTTSTHPDDVTSMLEWCRAEMDRRKPIMRRMRTDAITEFTPDLPLIVVIIDEAANYLRHGDKEAAARLRGELLAVVSQGAKYGVRVCLVTQRPDSTILDTATRAQLSFRISFRLEDKETAQMAFPDFEDPTVLLRCKPGVGWMREVGEGPRRFRSVFLQNHWAVADELPCGARVNIHDLDVRRETGTTVEHDDLVISLDDLDFRRDDSEEFQS